ncbi:MAG TPA: hypothetical protein VN039_10490 [Nitrospira sp.]|nr:hypothetical protein [Nitrospira sp.]
MAYDIATLTLAGGGGVSCHYQMLAKIKALAESVGWVTQRYDTTSSSNYEWIGKAPGLSGAEQIYAGFRTYQDSGADYYNLLAMVATGYLPGNTFDSQPGAISSGVPSHNNAITYFMTANAQRIALCMKVGTPVYEHAYVGKFFPYARPGEFPNPLFCAGMLNGAAAVRYSEATHTNGIMGYQPGGWGATRYGYSRDNNGAWGVRRHLPFNNRDSYNICNISRPADLVVAQAVYGLEPIIPYDVGTNVWGELDGVYGITGFNSGSENVVQLGGTTVDQTGMTVKQAVDAIIAAGGRAFVVLQDVARTTFGSYIALEMK